MPKKKKEKIFDENEENKIRMLSDLENIKESKLEAKYCMKKINIKWLKEFGRIDPEGASLFLDPRIPIFWRIFLPFVILLNFVNFIIADTGITTSIFLVFNVGRKIRAPSLFNATLSNTVQNAWEAGAWIIKNREKFLIILQSLAKFTILNIYALVILLIAFHFHIDFPVTEQSRAAKGSIADIFIHSGYSSTSLIIGIIISLILSHIIIYLHRGLYSHPDENKGENAENHKSIMSIAKTKYIGEIPFRIMISCILFLGLGFIIAGSFTCGLTFYFQGLAGYGLKLLKTPNYIEFTLFDMGKSLPSVYENPTDPAIILIQVVFLLTVLVFPFAFFVVIGILWFVPMTRKIQKFLYNIAEILNAWSGIDALVIIYVPSFLEIELFNKFMIGDKCDAIDPILETYFSEFLDGNNTCFKIQTVFEIGFWLLLVATVLFLILSFVLLTIFRNALNERLPDHVKELLKIKKEERIE